jgi:hypothetical protein
MGAVAGRKAFAATIVLLAAACADGPTGPESSTERSGADVTAARRFPGLPLPSGPSGLPWPFVQPTPPGPPVLVGAGDIARCDSQADEATADLVEGIAGTVFTAGDNAYQYGLLTEYLACYGPPPPARPSWGRPGIYERTLPAAGNHEYYSGGSGYFTYFGPQKTNAPLGYYSYNLGSWHVVVLNSTPQVYLCRPPETTEQWPPEGTPTTPMELPEPPPMNAKQGRACAGDLAQQAWLLADLAAHRRYRCTVVYFHHPRFSSARHGSHYQMIRIWDIMYAMGVDVVVSAHDHVYERFAPQDPNGRHRPRRGIRQFTVGTGGGPLYEFKTILPNSEVRDNTTHGVIKLTLGAGSYDWAFVPVANGTFTDSGTGTCH